MEGYGTTIWATTAAIRRARLFTKQGVVLGRWGWRRILRYNGEENIVIVGPQRSGKGTGVFIPTMLEVDGHTIIVDVRGDTYAATAGYRQTMSRVLRLSLTQPGSIRFNLLREVRKGTHRAFYDASLLADMLVDPGGNKPDRDHWEKTSQALITCAILYEVATEMNPTLSHIARFWSQPGASNEHILAHIVKHAPLPQVAELAQEVLNKTANERSGVISSMMTQLHLFRDPVVAANTSHSDFRLDDFMQQDRWLSLYLVQSSGEEAHIRPFMRCFLRLALARWLEISDQKHRITFFADEFTSYGRIPFFVDNLAVLGGRGIRTVIAVQNTPQLRNTYGDADTIIEQCKVRVFFAANGQTTGHTISQQTGTATAVTTQTSYRADGWSWTMADSRTQQEHHHSRALLTDAEAMQIPEDVAVIQVTGHPPIWAKKSPFFKVRHWLKRSRIAA